MTREERMAKRREAGKTYKYQPNPYKKGSREWVDEEFARAEKRKSHKFPYAKWTSTMKKLENELLKEKLEKSKKSYAKKALSK